MDLQHFDPILTLLGTLAHIIEYAGATLFLLFAAWCCVMEAIGLTAAVLRTLLAYARARTEHACDAIRGVRDELRNWAPGLTRKPPPHGDGLP